MSLIAAIALAATLHIAYAETRQFEFIVQTTNITRLCQSKTIVTVNGMYPGPEIRVNEGDWVTIVVRNMATSGISIHWHGLYQNRTCWFDGPSYVTQCPISPGQAFTYNFTTRGQRGTLWWHAHTSWLRATVYGAFIIHPVPKRYPFIGRTLPEYTIILGQWWNSDVLEVINQAVQTGGAPELSNAYTINGMPGPLYGSCSEGDTVRLSLETSETYLMRIVNAAMDVEMFVAVANHTLQVVEADASYLRPFNTSAIVIAPGQTTNVLLTTRRGGGSYYIAAGPYTSAPGVPFDNSITAAILEVGGPFNTTTTGELFNTTTTAMPNLPDPADTAYVDGFVAQMRSANSGQVFSEVDKEMIITVGFNLQSCPPDAAPETCQFFGARFAASMNNVSYTPPSIGILQAYYSGDSSGVYTTDFPEFPAEYDYTGVPPANLDVVKGTKVFVLDYGTKVQIILQGTSLLTNESHPMHLHGFDVHIVGQGYGNYNPSLSSTFNLEDPPRRNTVQVPAGGWLAMRFRADNPGAWYFHCHLDNHLTVGLGTVMIVKDGERSSQKLEPPPADLPQCS